MKKFSPDLRGTPERHLYYLTLDTQRDRPDPSLDPDEMFPYHRMTAKEAAWYYSRSALATLVSNGNPGRAIELFEELVSVLAARIRFILPGTEYSLYLERELERLPVLYERVGQFEDALQCTSVSFHAFRTERPLRRCCNPPAGRLAAPTVPVRWSGRGGTLSRPDLRMDGCGQPKSTIRSRAT